MRPNHIEMNKTLAIKAAKDTAAIKTRAYASMAQCLGYPKQYDTQKFEYRMKR